MAEVLELLKGIFTFEIERPLDRVVALHDEVRAGNIKAAMETLEIAERNPKDAEIYFDYVPYVLRGGLVEAGKSKENVLSNVVKAMAALLEDNESWGNRNYDGVNAPLYWLMNVASLGAGSGRPGLLEDATDALFKADSHWERFKQRQRSRAWLEGLVGRDAGTVARVLRRHPDAIAWYTKEGWEPSAHADPLIRSALLP
jgi:hypothetical protein